jgi:hypothetical protein
VRHKRRELSFALGFKIPRGKRRKGDEDGSGPAYAYGMYERAHWKDAVVEAIIAESFVQQKSKKISSENDDV